MTGKQDHKQEDDIASQVLEHLKNPPIEVINPKNSSGSNTKKYLIITSILIIIFAAAGFAAWKFLLTDSNQTADQPVSETESQNEAANGSSLSELTQEYTSDRLLIDFKYPTDWKVDENSGEIIVYSQEAEITDVSGEAVSAEFRLLIKQGAEETDSEYLGHGFVIKKSKPIKYTDPAAGQRKKSFVTDFGLDSSDNFAYFIVQGNFELEKDETLGPDFAKEADAILISGGFYSKDSKGKTKLVSLDPETYQLDEAYLSAIEIVKTLRLR